MFFQKKIYFNGSGPDKKQPALNEMKKGMLTFTDASKLLEMHGINVAGRVGKSREDAVQMAREYGCPCAIKVISSDIVHKTEREAVFLNVRPEEVGDKYDLIQARFSDAKIDGILVQPMVEGGVEFLVGATRDPKFGPVVTFGVGGKMVEVIKDVAHGVSHLTQEDARRMIRSIKSQKLITGFRGTPPLDIYAMAKVIVSVSDLMWKNPCISEIDLNPVIWNGKLNIVDPRLIAGEVTAQVCTEPRCEWKEQSIRAITQPRSCVLVGASMKVGSVPYTAVESMLKRFPAEGDMHLVNPKFEEGAQTGICGRKVTLHNDTANIPAGVELAVFMTPAKAVPLELDKFGAKGGRGAVIISDGFSEAGNRELEDEVRRVAKKYGIGYLGPNCLGAITDSVNTMFIPNNRTSVLGTQSPISIIAQSGGIGLELLEHLARDGLGVANWFSCGNASCFTVADLLDYLASDAKTKVIGIYLESIPNGLEFYEALKRACRDKPVMIIKGGVTDRGAEATASHTGAVTKNIDVFNSACDQAGAIRVDTVKTMANALSILSTQRRPPANNAFVLSDGGGIGISVTDKCVKAGIALEELDEKTVGAIRQIDGLQHAHIANPFDTLGSTNDERLVKVIEALNADPKVGCILALVYFQVPRISENKIFGAIGEINRKMEKPLIVAPRGDGPYLDYCRKELENAGVQTYIGDEYFVKPLQIALQAWKRYGNTDFTKTG